MIRQRIMSMKKRGRDLPQLCILKRQKLSSLFYQELRKTEKIPQERFRQKWNIFSVNDRTEYKRAILIELKKESQNWPLNISRFTERTKMIRIVRRDNFGRRRPVIKPNQFSFFNLNFCIPLDEINSKPTDFKNIRVTHQWHSLESHRKGC